ncbi:MAG: DUF3854 domain-containing protein, partial [Deltaproteobacteria bacterium]|nr:DUF3854 domain-containing protein [Deltaproteobacteria bacterium]
MESARERTNREGVPYWVHACDPSAVPPSVSEVVSKSALSIATDEVRDQAYRAILDALGLSPAHRELLRARGLSEREIEQGQYCTLEVRGRAALARRAADAVGKFAVAGVPGIVWEARTERGWWTLKGAAGLVIPSRNVRGQIVALKVRSESPEGSRYTSVSSRSAGGPASACNVHFPRQTSARFASKRVLWITEGELKADAAAALSDWAIVGLPGVSMWRGAVALAHELGARRVVVALDADWKTKPEVQTARTDLVRALERSGLSVHAVDWPIALG